MTIECQLFQIQTFKVVLWHWFNWINWIKLIMCLVYFSRISSKKIQFLVLNNNHMIFVWESIDNHIHWYFCHFQMPYYNHTCLQYWLWCKHKHHLLCCGPIIMWQIRLFIDPKIFFVDIKVNIENGSNSNSMDFINDILCNCFILYFHQKVSFLLRRINVETT